MLARIWGEITTLASPGSDAEITEKRANWSRSVIRRRSIVTELKTVNVPSNDRSEVA